MFHNIVALLLSIALILSLLLTEQQYQLLLCRQANISIKEHPNQSFITEKSILDWLQRMHAIPGSPLITINGHTIYNQLMQLPFVKKASVFKTLDGTLHLCIETKCLISRLITNDWPEDKHGPTYLDEDGQLITFKEPPLLRLLILSGYLKQWIEEIAPKKIVHSGLLTLLHELYKNPFWRYQITTIQVEDNQEITLGTQIGNHTILFGAAEDIYTKLEKLQLFYTYIIPYKGWNAYRCVNLLFDKQIICE